MLPEHCTVWTCCSSNMRTAFTPLSTVLGSMIRELHRALLQALVVENYNLTLTQLIKVGAVAANTGAWGGHWKGEKGVWVFSFRMGRGQWEGEVMGVWVF